MIYLLSPLKKEGSIHLPMIHFTLLESSLDFSQCDTLMFTSKEAVKSAELLNSDWKNIPCLAIGSATAKEIESLGGKVLYQPKQFYGKTLSEDILRLFKEKHILYLRPQVVSFDAKTFLRKAGLRIEEKMIYKTSCMDYSDDDKPLQNAIIIFTSPSTIKCFFKNFQWDESYTAVVIGEATKEHLHKNITVEVAEKPLIDSCISKAREILLTSNSK
ncbi:MAG: uroporphyrinogen-III synthase [Campylobacterota bacterium]|nr:uroporphyrinogen-III synthase [Campylobacterota bacterium]